MNTRITASAWAFAFILILGTGCASSFSKRLNRLELGMTAAQTKKILGDNYVVKASRTDASGATLQMSFATRKPRKPTASTSRRGSSHSGDYRPARIFPSSTYQSAERKVHSPQSTDYAPSI